MKKTRRMAGAASKKKSEEANQYDKVLKEALRHATPALLTHILKVPAKDFEPLHIELHRTIERKADFLGKCYAADAIKRIVHLEIQAKDEHDMIGRMLLYAALIISNYLDWDLEQIVFCISEKRPTMPTSFQKTVLDYRFRLVWIKDIDYRAFIATGQPELMLLGVLAGHGERSAEEVMVEVVNEVRRATESDLDFSRHAEQLHILSNLHNLQQIFEKVMLNISELIDEKKDPFFQRGEKIGIEKGRQEGISIGMTEKTLLFVTNLILESDHDNAFIARIADVEQQAVAQIRELIRQHPNDYRQRLKDFKIDLLT